MVKLKQLICSSVVLVSLGGGAQAEALYTVSNPQLSGVTLFEQTLNESALVTVKPAALEDVSSQLTLNQCLWSVNVSLDGGKPAFSPGKMICVGPNQEVLEATPVGEIAEFGRCSDSACSSFIVEGDQVINMNLSAAIEFSLQPRNERQ